MSLRSPLFSSPPRLFSYLGWLLLVALIVVAVPLHVAMPVWVDSTYFDECARSLLHHGRFYDDVFCHVFPGMVWLHAALRGCFGWRIEVVRLADFAVVSAIVGLLVSKVRPLADRASAKPWPAIALLLGYCATGESCHAQPDMWMLLPALLAFILRQARTPPETNSRLALAEGICWGLAFVIKPFVLASALACWGVIALLAWRSGHMRRLLFEASRTLAGFVIVVGLAILWLWLSGDGPFFLEPYLGKFNHEYYQSSRGGFERALAMIAWLLPWSLIHVVAVPLAVVELWGMAFGKRRDDAATPLFAAFYLAWLFQANFVQRQLPYHLVPPLLLGMALLLGRLRGLHRPLGFALVGVIVVALLPHPQLMVDLRTWEFRAHPLLVPRRIALWGQCWLEGSSTALRDALSLEPTGSHWGELAQVEDFLRGQELHDRELTCYSLSSVSLYPRLGVRPSTRWVFLWSACEFFPRHQASILREVTSSPQRFIVTDIRDLDLEHALNPVLDPPLPDRFPWCEPVVFRCGLYRVHQVPTRGGN